MYLNKVSKVEKSLFCPCCEDIAQKAVVSTCCNKLFCSRCVNKNNKYYNCDWCGKAGSFRDAYFARKLIESLYNMCEDCN